MKEKAVVVCSGGLDSTVLLYYMIDGGYEPIVVTFLYGQKHSIENEYIRRTCAKLDVELHSLNIPTLPGSSLTDIDKEIPKDDYSVETQKSTVVPNRNMVFLSIAASYAIAYGAETIWYAAHHNDQAVYPDCRQDFVSMLNVALAYGNYKKIRVEAPFIMLDKSKIVCLGKQLGMPFEDTWSCYDPVSEIVTTDIPLNQLRFLHCGVCGTCRERKLAFIEAGVEDPTRYAK